ncbi:hypothetical protein JHW43_000206 [Diplocarpon mali]|nr:hypothetical protein JHW43_000206 [Diplocarpon mali]
MTMPWYLTRKGPASFDAALPGPMPRNLSSHLSIAITRRSHSACAWCRDSDHRSLNYLPDAPLRPCQRPEPQVHCLPAAWRLSEPHAAPPFSSEAGGRGGSRKRRRLGTSPLQERASTIAAVADSRDWRCDAGLGDAPAARVSDTSAETGCWRARNHKGVETHLPASPESSWPDGPTHAVDLRPLPGTVLQPDRKIRPGRGSPVYLSGAEHKQAPLGHQIAPRVLESHDENSHLLLQQ